MKPTYEELETQHKALAAFKQEVLGRLGMGSDAPHFAVFENIENMRRFSETLHAVERQFFTRELSDEEIEGETFCECPLLWGMTVEQYLSTFAKCLDDVRAQSIEEGIQIITYLLNHQAPGVKAALELLQAYANRLRNEAGQCANVQCEGTVSDVDV